ncbi:MAG: hypothetical protein NVS4B7_14370 [Ktedonobacteraceae bacterium]
MQESEPVIIVDYDPHWPVLYEEEKARILTVIGTYIANIQHMGSTAIPELASKPVIDILVELKNISFVNNCIQPLASLSYQYMGPPDPIGKANDHFFRKPPPGAGNRTHHLHMVEQDSDYSHRQLLFRDYLRLHPEEAHQYDILKRELAEKFGTNRQGYIDAKTDFVEAILVKAALHE